MNITLKRAMVVSMVAVFVASAFGATLFVDDAYADTPIEIVDSTGETITLDAPANKVVTIGLGFTTSVVMLGGKDMIVGYDTYSAGLIAEENIVAEPLGSGYSSQFDILLAGMIQLSGEGSEEKKFDKNTDLVILNNFSATLAEDGIRDQLEDEGFKVLCFGANTYDGVLDVVQNIAKAIGKESSVAMTKMITARENAVAVAATIPAGEEVRAMYVADYGGALRIYNSGIAVSMIELAGGVNVGNNGGTTTYYDTEASAIIQLSPDIVFLDGNYPLEPEEFLSDILEDHPVIVVKLDKDWNNFSPAIADGLDAISVEIMNITPGVEEPDEGFSSTTLVIGAVAIVAVLVIAGLFIVRRH